MIEYLYNAIRATAGENITITANITDEAGEPITKGYHISLYDDEKMLETVDGNYFEGLWEFTIPAEATTNLIGRYWYCICDNEHTKLNFKQPLYLV